MPVSASKKTRNTASDPHDIERRCENQIHLHLLDMEEHPEFYPAKDRLAAIAAIGMWLNRKYGWGDDETAGAGSAVRRYAGAFLTKPVSVTKSRPTGVSGGIQRVATDADEEDAA